MVQGPVGDAVFLDPRVAHSTANLPAVGGRLLQFRQNWEIIFPDNWVSSVVNSGYLIEFSRLPPATGLMRVTPVPSDPAKRSALETEIRGLVDKRAVQIVHPSDAHNLIRSNFFLAPKKPNLWRPILNLKPLNKAYIKTKKFRMETLTSIIPTLSTGMWATSIDLKDAYLHIPIHKDHQRYLAFRYRGIDYSFQALPFGLATAPRVFSRVTRAVLAYLRRNGILLFAYLDDWLILGNSKVQASKDTQFVIQTLQDLGWVINWQKSSIVPSQQITYLGAHLDFKKGQAFPTPERAEALRTVCLEVLSSKAPKARTWLRLLGLMASMVEILPFCRLRMRPIQFYVLRFFKPDIHPLSLRIPMSEVIRPFLHWWTVLKHILIGRPFVSIRPQTTITTDASNFGWGAVWGTLSAAGQWSDAERRLHINILELTAVLRAIQTWGTHLKGYDLTIVSDNSTTVAYLNRQGGTRSLHLCSLTWDLLILCQNLDISVRANHLAGKLNVLADALSRGKVDMNEWSLAQTWADYVFQLFGRPTVDLFATSINHKLPTFCSRYFHPRAWATDALAMSWDNLSTYAFPPLCLILTTLLKFSRSFGDMLLIAPCWPNQPWFPLILNLLVDRPFRFPTNVKLLSQKKGQIFHQDLESLHLTAWKLSTNDFKRREFLDELQTLQSSLGDIQHPRLIIRDWRYSQSGQHLDLLIPWRHP